MTEVVTVDERTRDFSRKRNVKFNIDHADGTPEVFYGVPGLPALTLAEFAAASDKMDDAGLSEQVALFGDMFELVLTDESAGRFVARMKDKTDPIDIDQVRDIIPWIMEQYGMRPTAPSSDSSPGSVSPDGGTNSMGDARPVGLMFERSLPSGSSTSSTAP